MDTLEALKAKLQSFADQRDWDQFHSSKYYQTAVVEMVDALVTGV